MIDGNGITVASYEYDPYGKVLSATGSMASINPLRYRGYYYDNETHLYYCLSRYYDPQTGRFISPDSYVSTGQGILGHNMFAYCNNNPATYIDSTGTFPIDNNRFRSNSALHGGGNFSDGGISGVVRKEQPDWLKRLNPANSDERVVLEAKFFAFYKGVPVFRINLGHGGGFSYGIIVLDDYYQYDDDGINTLKHEYGHRIHMAQIGIINYTLQVVPYSVLFAELTNRGVLSDDMYFNWPWERIADYLGGVNRNNYASWADAAGILYWLMTLACR